MDIYSDVTMLASLVALASAVYITSRGVERKEWVNVVFGMAIIIYAMCNLFSVSFCDIILR